MKIQELVPDTAYTFTTKPWTTPFGEIIPSRSLKRVFIGHKQIENIPFIEVERPGWRPHLIAVESIASITLQ